MTRASILTVFILSLAYAYAQSISWFDCPLYTNNYVLVNSTTSLADSINQEAMNDLLRQYNDADIMYPFMPIIEMNQNFGNIFFNVTPYF